MITQQKQKLVRDEYMAGLLLVPLVFLTGLSMLGCLTPINLRVSNAGTDAETIRLD